MEKSVFESIMTGITEAIDDTKGKVKLEKRVVTVLPVKHYSAEKVKEIRHSIGLSQRLFANYIGVSQKTVEAWEAGTNQPSGAASRILNMMEMDDELITHFPFVSL